MRQPRNNNSVRLICSKCTKEYFRTYKPYDNGFGNCNLDDAKLIPALKRQLNTRLMKAKEDYNRINSFELGNN